MSEELKPCPFCGGEAHVSGLAAHSSVWLASCSFCHARKDGRSEAEALAAWNTRQSATTEQLAAMEQAREALATAERVMLWANPRMACGDYAKVIANDVRNTGQALATLTEQIERMRVEAQQPSGAMTGE